MKYNFYTTILSFCLLSAITFFLIKHILQECELPYYLLLIHLVICGCTFLWYLLMTPNTLSQCVQTMKRNKPLFFKIVATGCLYFVCIFLGAIALRQESLLRYSLWKQIGRIIIITLLTYLFIRNELTLQKIIGILIIIMGLYLVETSAIQKI